MSELTKEKLFNFIDSAKALGLKSIKIDFESELDFYKALCDFVELNYIKGAWVYGSPPGEVCSFDIGGFQILFVTAIKQK